ncbi:MAG TPA: hypothetical protein VMB24_05115 [Dehalococcoidales bacterium]|nr:hypothetical protein [Dehalococcoidales bacterium]
MRIKPRGTLQVNSDVKRLFMLAKPTDTGSSDFLKQLLESHVAAVREAHERAQKYPGIAALNEFTRRIKSEKSCLGRPKGAKDIQPRKRRTKKQLAKAKQQQ